MTPLDALTQAVRNRGGVLFVGSGMTADSGGASWGELARWVAAELGVSPRETPKDTLDDLCIRLGRRSEVYSLVAKRLANVEAGSALRTLLDLPWTAIYTTNFDTAIEEYYRDGGQVRPLVYTDARRVMYVTPGTLPVFKIMGCRTAPSGSGGQMALSSADIARKERENHLMFEHLDEFVGASAVLAVGYSFDDGILEKSAEVIRGLSAKSHLPITAVFRAEPSAARQKRFEILGIEPIISPATEFAVRLAEQVAKTVESTQLALIFGGRTLSIDAARLTSLLEQFDLVTRGELDRKYQPRDFFRGRTSELVPYSNQLQWNREVIQRERSFLEKWSALDPRPPALIHLYGRPGSGKTVAANAVLYSAIREFDSVGLRLGQRAATPDEDVVVSFGKSVRSLAENRRAFLTILLDDQTRGDNALNFINSLQWRGFADVLVVSVAFEAADLKRAKEFGVEVCQVEVPDSIDVSEIAPFANYVDQLDATVRPFRWSRAEIESQVSTDRTFIELMYRLVDESRRSFQDIARQAVLGLGISARTLVELILLSTLGKTPVPLPILAKVQRCDYSELYQLLDECAQLVVVDETPATPTVSFYHARFGELVAQALGGAPAILSALQRVLEVANLESGVEHQFVVDLLVGRPGREERESPVDSIADSTTVLSLFERLESRGITSLLRHHQGIRLSDSKQYAEALKVLDNALVLAQTEDPPTERLEIIQTTRADTLWKSYQGKELPGVEQSTEVLRVRELLRESRSGSRWNLHSYGIEARVLRDLATRVSGARRLALLGEAMGVLQEGWEASGRTDAFLADQMARLSEEEGDLDVARASELLRSFGTGFGFFLLYERARRADHHAEARRYLESAEGAKSPCVPAFRAGLEMELVSDEPSYSKAVILSDMISRACSADPKRWQWSWLDMVQRATALVGAERGNEVRRLLGEIRQTTPRLTARPYLYFIRQRSRRREFSGQVKEVTYESVGSIYPHDVPNLGIDLFFNPRRPGSVRLRQGERVRFTLAFGIHGITAWDPEPI